MRLELSEGLDVRSDEESVEKKETKKDRQDEKTTGGCYCFFEELWNANAFDYE